MNLSKNGRWGIAAVMAVALVAAGAALAATKIHTGGHANAAGAGPALQANGEPPPRGVLSAAATYLGIDTATLAHELRDGRTLAQIADATPGKSASGLVDALVAAARGRFGGGPDENDDDRGDDGPAPSAPTRAVPPTHI